MENQQPENSAVVLRLFAIVLLVIGIVLGVGGAQLAQLGGSPYYVIAGLVTAMSAILLWRRKGAGATLYALMVFGTIAWSLWEVGLNGWDLAPRLAGPIVL